TEGWRRTSLRGLPLDGIRVTSQASEVKHTGRAQVLDLREAPHDATFGPILQKYFGQVVQPEVDKFTALHYAFFNAGSLVYIPRSMAVEEPVWLTHAFDAPFVHTLV